MVDVLIVSLVFGYAGWTLYRFVKKSKKGQCSGCAHENSCSSACHESSEVLPH